MSATDPASPQARVDIRTGWLMVAILCLGQMLNYFDRSVVGIAATAIMRDLKLSLTDYGLLASAFFSLYGISGVVIGLTLSGRVRPRILLAAMVAVWAVTQIPIVLAPSLSVLVACRAALGAAESASISTSVAAAHEWFAPHRRAVPTALVMVGPLLGSIVAPPILAGVMTSYGWRTGFVVCAILSALVAALLLVVGRDGPDAAVRPARTADARPPGVGIDWRLLRDPVMLAITLTGFCAYWITAFAVAWLFPMIQVGIGLTAVEAAWIVSAIFGLSAVTMLASGWFNGALLKRGLPSRRAVVVPMVGALVVGSGCIAAMGLVGGDGVRLALLAVAIALVMSVSGAIPLLVSEIAPLAQRNAMLVVILSLTSMAGFAAPYVTGLLVRSGGGLQGYLPGLYLCAAISLTGAVVAVTMLHPAAAIARRNARHIAQTGEGL